MEKDRRIKGRWHRFIRFCKARILHVNDSPHRIALGVAIGVFVGWTPIIGPHMIMALILSALLRANKIVGVLSVWISNPFTAGIIYGPSYFVGRAVVSLWKNSPGVSWKEFWELMSSLDSQGSIITNFHRPEFWHELFHVFVKIGVELWIGCIIVGFVAAVIGYFLVRSLIMWYRKRHPHRRFETYT
jgi:uncharacterized protein (DUF2062 family)